MLMSAELKLCVTWLIYFLIFFSEGITAKLHHCRLRVTDFREEPILPPPHLWTTPKKLILNKIKEIFNTFQYSMHCKICQWSNVPEQYFTLKGKFQIFLCGLSLQNEKFVLPPIKKLWCSMFRNNVLMWAVDYEQKMKYGWLKLLI